MSGVLARIAGIAIPDSALVTPVLGSTVVDVNETGVTLQDADGARRRLGRREGRPRSPEGPRRAAVPLPRTRGNLATVGRTAAVADIKGIKLSGFLASTTWVLVHLFYLMGFQNRLLVLIRWSISFATRGRGVRLITSPANADAAGRPAAHPEPLMPRTEVSQVR
jgi:hypothetical protein